MQYQFESRGETLPQDIQLDWVLLLEIVGGPEKSRGFLVVRCVANI